MINAIQSDTLAYPGTTRLIIHEAAKRGWNVFSLKVGSSHMFIDRGDGRLLHLYGSALPTLSYSAGIFVDNKYYTSQILEENEIPQLPSVTVDLDAEDHVIEAFLKEQRQLVCKPIDGAHGNGVRANLQSLSDVRAAMTYAKAFTKSTQVLLQKQFPSDIMYDLRLLCIDGHFSAAIHRIPARVYGDGKSTIRELIENENKKDTRGKAYKSRYTRIDYERAKSYLGRKISAIPASGEEVRVLDVANYGAGGELVDVTDAIPAWMKEEAEKAARILELPVAGVDFITSAIPYLTMARRDVEAYIIEVNKAPTLAIHDEPHVGKNRHTVARLLDLLASI